MFRNGAELWLGGVMAFEALCLETPGPEGMPIQAIMHCLQYVLLL